HNGTGCYTIYLNIIDPKDADASNRSATRTQVMLTQGAITATNFYANGNCSGLCNIITVGPLGSGIFAVVDGGDGLTHTKFAVNVKVELVGEGTAACANIDGDFMFHVIGRQ